MNEQNRYSYIRLVTIACQWILQRRVPLAHQKASIVSAIREETINLH